MIKSKLCEANISASSQNCKPYADENSNNNVVNYFNLFFNIYLTHLIILKSILSVIIEV